MKSFFVSHGSFFLEVRQAPRDRIIGKWDIYRHGSGPIREGFIPGTGGQVDEVSAPLNSCSWAFSTYEFRNYWNGVSDLKIIQIELVHR